MTVDRLEVHDDHVTVRITDNSLTVPAPFDEILRQHLAALPHQTTSTHAADRWLFPAAQPGRHANQSALMTKLRRAGIDLQGAKNATIRALVMDMPAPIVADALGYSYPTADRHRRDAGATFIDYIGKRNLGIEPPAGAMIDK